MYRCCHWPDCFPSDDQVLFLLRGNLVPNQVGLLPLDRPWHRWQPLLWVDHPPPHLCLQVSHLMKLPLVFNYREDDEGAKPAEPQYPIFAVCLSALKISTCKTMRSWNSSSRLSTLSLPSSSQSRCFSSGSHLVSGDTLEASGLASTSSLSL